MNEAAALQKVLETHLDKALIGLSMTERLEYVHGLMRELQVIATCTVLASPAPRRPTGGPTMTDQPASETCATCGGRKYIWREGNWGGVVRHECPDCRSAASETCATCGGSGRTDCDCKGLNSDGDLRCSVRQPCPDCTHAASEAPGGGVAEARSAAVRAAQLEAAEYVDESIETHIKAAVGFGFSAGHRYAREAASAAGDARLREAARPLAKMAEDFDERMYPPDSGAQHISVTLAQLRGLRAALAD